MWCFQSDSSVRTTCKTSASFASQPLCGKAESPTGSFGRKGAERQRVQRSFGGGFASASFWNNAFIMAPAHEPALRCPLAVAGVCDLGPDAPCCRDWLRWSRVGTAHGRDGAPRLRGHNRSAAEIASRRLPEGRAKRGKPQLQPMPGHFLPMSISTASELRDHSGRKTTPHPPFFLLSPSFFLLPPVPIPPTISLFPFPFSLLKCPHDSRPSTRPCPAC